MNHHSPPGAEADDLCFADGRAHQAAIRDGRATRADLVRAQIARAHAVNGEFHAFSSLVSIEEATAAAAALDRSAGRTLTSPLDGLALSVKGSLPVKGRLWTEGSRVFAGRIADHSAAAVQMLEKAGTVFLGTTTLSELAFYSPDNAFETHAINPLSPLRTAGGSTAGGGAAAALGAAVLNLGTDSGGSIRNPACHCGVVGFKPTLKRWPTDGAPAYAPSLSALGMITRSVADIQAADAVLSGIDDTPATFAPLFLVPEALIARYADEATQSLFAAALGRLKAKGFAIELFEEPSWEAGERSAGVVSLAEGFASTRGLDKSLMAPALAARLERGKLTTPEQLAAAYDAVKTFAAALGKRVPEGAVILTPTWPFRAPKIYQMMAVVQGRRVPMDPHRNIFVRAANAADAPALSMPAGFYPGRVPFGLHLMAPSGRDADVLSAAAKIETIVGEAAPRDPRSQ